MRRDVSRFFVTGETCVLQSNGVQTVFVLSFFENCEQAKYNKRVLQKKSYLENNTSL